MAKKKSKEEEASIGMTTDEATDALEKTFARDYGEGVIKSAQDIFEEEREVFSVSPAIDIALGGGFVGGSWISVSGPEKLGKSATILTFCAQAQKSGRLIVYFDVECKLEKRDLNVAGLKRDEKSFKYIRSTKEKFLSNLEICNIAEQYIKNVPRVVIVFDSISAMANASLVGEEFNKSDYGSGHKVFGNFISMCRPAVRINSSIVIGIIQQYANTSGYGSDKAEKVSSAWKYQSNIKLIGKFSKPWRTGSDETGPEIGKIINWQVGHSPLAAPGAKFESYFRYNVGIDRVFEMLQIADELKVIKVGGAWVTLSFLTAEDVAGTEYEKKFTEKGEITIQGMQRAYKLLEDNPSWALKLTEIINKETGIV